MDKPKDPKPRKRFVRVTDKDGTEYVCRIEDLKNPDQLSEEEKAACFPPPPAFE